MGLSQQQTMDSVNIDDFTIRSDNPIVDLDCTVAFNNLTEKEKKYAHYLSKASFDGGLIVLLQTSPESPVIFALLHKLLSAEPLNDFKIRAAKTGATEDEIQALLMYACGIFTEMGNYKGLGDIKIVPNLSSEVLKSIITSSKAFETESEKLMSLWNDCKTRMYSLNLTDRFLGLNEKGTTTYFTPNCSQSDSDLVAEYLKSVNLEPYNNRVFKTIENGTPVYEIRLASVLSEPGDEPFLLPEGLFKGCTFRVTRGDYSPLLALVNKSLKEATNFTSNETEEKMLNEYIKSFHTGSLQAHKDGSREWIKNKGPVIETYIGFIETYRDPAGMRGEFEGFVAMVNKEVSAKYTELVAKAKDQLKEMPWPSTFEKDKFLKPDFTSLDVLTFAGSMIPAGINIPNYDEIRQDEGFKNVSLGNVIPASYKGTHVPFLSEEDSAMLEKYRVASFEVQVALHELLGHGSGKLFCRGLDGKCNFDPETVINPLTGNKIESWYEAGETYDTKFTSLGSAYEECRAECVGLYLCFSRTVLGLFGIKEEEEETIIYANWLSLLSNGCSKALEMYQPSTKTWLQAHAQARYVILRVCIEAGEGLIKITETEPGKNLLLTVDRTKLSTVGRKAVGDFLLKLQVYKATGDIKAARAMFDKYSEVPEDGPHPWVKWRDIALAHKQPRKMMVQPNTSIEGDKVKLTTYSGTVDGLIQSILDRFVDDSRVEALLSLRKKDAEHYAASSQ